jgi:hypothetical protein
VTLVTDKEKHRVASHAALPATDPISGEGNHPKKKLSRKEAAKRLVSLAEENMKRKGLSEEEKNFRVGRFAAFVDNLKKSLRRP